MALHEGRRPLVENVDIVEENDAFRRMMSLVASYKCSQQAGTQYASASESCWHDQNV